MLYVHVASGSTFSICYMFRHRAWGPPLISRKYYLIFNRARNSLKHREKPKVGECQRKPECRLGYHRLHIVMHTKQKSTSTMPKFLPSFCHDIVFFLVAARNSLKHREKPKVGECQRKPECRLGYHRLHLVMHTKQKSTSTMPKILPSFCHDIVFFLVAAIYHNCH